MLVEIAYASLTEQVILPVDIVEGETIEQAIQKSGILDAFPEIQLDQNSVGIFGKAESLSTVLKAKDRVEIYRPISCDPKEVRRQRAKKKK